MDELVEANGELAKANDELANSNAEIMTMMRDAQLKKKGMFFREEREGTGAHRQASRA